MRIICEGCGQLVSIPDGYRRNKIQCACGVICRVPETVRQETNVSVPTRPTAAAKPPPALEDEAERWLLEDDPPLSEQRREPPRFRDPEPEPRREPATKPTVADRRFGCRRCGQLVRRQGECPICDADKIPAAPPEPIWPSVDAHDDEDKDKDDGSPYGVDGADDVRCPNCSNMLPPASVLCVRCGFHLTKRKKVAKSYQPIERTWETTYSLSARLTFFAICEGVALTLGLIGVFEGGADLGVFIGSFLVLTAMLGFLFGTFDRIHLTRDARGRVRLTKTWRVCFFARQPKTIDVRGYEGILSGRHRAVSPWDSWLLYFLIIFGIIPGLIWWYLVFYKLTYHVSLSREHGFPEYILYSGWNEAQMKEIAFTLRDASGLHYDEG
jgi:hypothetical protein